MTVERPLYARAVDEMVAILQNTADNDAALNHAFYFEVSKYRSRPYIESLHNKAFVNIRIDKIETDGSQTSIHSRVHKVTFNIDLYAKGNNNDEEYEDTAAAERLIWLIAQVETAIYNLKNSNFGLATGEIVRAAADYSCQFYSTESDESSSTYSPARISFTCTFPYKFQEFAPDSLSSIETGLLKDWSLLFRYR